MRVLSRTVVVNLTLIGFSLMLSLVVVEIALRLSYSDPIKDDPFLSHVHVPGGEWDAKGFRNPQALQEADIVAIGDSQTEGNNAKSEEAWPQVLGRLASTSVYSMGVPGYGPVQYAYLANEAITLRPKHIIVALYLGNDLMDAERVTYELNHWKQLRNPMYVREEQTGGTDFRVILGSGVAQDSFAYRVLKIRMWIRSHSRVYGLVGDATRSLREALNIADTRAEKQEAIKGIAADRPDIAYVYDADPRFETVLSPTYRLDTVGTEDTRAAEGWRITQERLRDIKKTINGNGVALSIVIIPTKEMVYIDYMEKQREAVPEEFRPYAVSERELVQTILAFCSENALECFSVLPGMSEAMVDGVSLYGTTMDGHPKAEGYRVIAELVLDAVVRRHSTE